MRTPVEKQTVWVVFQNVGNFVTEFQGVFSTKEAAIAACHGSRYYIGPAVMDEVLPDDAIEWPGCYYPHQEPDPGENNLPRDWQQRVYQREAGQDAPVDTRTHN